MDFLKITNEYYSQWLGILPEFFNSNGVIFIDSPERDKIPKGYSKVFNIYSYITNHQIIVSYSKTLTEKIDRIKSRIQFGMHISEIATIFEETFNTPVGRSIKFLFDRFPNNINTTNVVCLNDNHYQQYVEFYTTLYKNTNVDDWLYQYFHHICKDGYAFGIFDNNKLVSITDAPDMPFMEDKVQEIGINTLFEYRSKGYAKSVSTSCIKAIIEKGKCPLWSCSVTNTASEKLAYKVGFQKLAEVMTISI